MKSATASEPSIFYYHPDHLGSTAVVTDVDGRITQNVVYIPFGEVFVEQRDGNWNTPYLFNAKELDEETGLYYYGARYLDPTGTTWLSVDPLFEKYVGMSPYGYCAGNPVKLVDVDGKEFDETNEQKAQGIENNIALKISEPQAVEEITEDITARIAELQLSKQDIVDMRAKQGVYYQYASSSEPSNPAGGGNPTIVGLNTNTVTMYVDDNMGSTLHEGRHGGDAARDILTYENYGASHEVSAYKAQYSWEGELRYFDEPNERMMQQRLMEGAPLNQNIIREILSIDLNTVRSIRFNQNGVPHPLYPPEGISQENFFGR